MQIFLTCMSERGGSADGSSAGPQLRDQRVRCELPGSGSWRHAGRGVGRRGRPHSLSPRRTSPCTIAHRGHARLDPAHHAATERGLARI